MPETNSPKSKKSCFVIGPIGDAGSETRKHSDLLLNAVILPIVSPNYAVTRADLEKKSGMITDLIIQKVMQCDLVIADLTTLNPNVFYELGIRHAVQKPTIHMAARSVRLPFDNAGHNTIFFDLTEWQSQEDARSELQAQIADTETPGFKASNPVTQSVTLMTFTASADSEEKTIANLLTRVSQLELERKSGTRQSSAPDEPNLAALARSATNSQAKRRASLFELVEAIQDETNETFTDRSIARFLDLNSNVVENYQDILDKLKAGDLDDVVEEIRAYERKFHKEENESSDDDIPF